jgi:hypothetical protein
MISTKNFLRTTKNRLSDPSEISALEFKGEILPMQKLLGQRLSASIVDLPDFIERAGPRFAGTVFSARHVDDKAKARQSLHGTDVTAAA